MTHALDANARVAELDRARAAPAAAATSRSTTSKFGTFVITFGIAFAILYTVFERLNWPLFTYHPAVGKLDFWMQKARSGEGPPMYWYGWIALSTIAALPVALVGTFLSAARLQRLTVFACVLAALWPIAFALTISIADRMGWDTDLLEWIWVAAVPAFLLAAGAAWFTPLRWAQRLWTGWLLIVPIVGLVVLGYSLKQYFLK
jgi:hypothetical protein